MNEILNQSIIEPKWTTVLKTAVGKHSLSKWPVISMDENGWCLDFALSATLTKHRVRLTFTSVSELLFVQSVWAKVPVTVVAFLGKLKCYMRNNDSVVYLLSIKIEPAKQISGLNNVCVIKIRVGIVFKMYSSWRANSAGPFHYSSNNKLLKHLLTWFWTFNSAKRCRMSHFYDR